MDEPETDLAELYRRMAADQGVAFAPGRYSAAVVAHEGMREALSRLRAEPSPFVGTVAEPASALAWIEHDGVRP